MPIYITFIFPSLKFQHLDYCKNIQFLHLKLNSRNKNYLSSKTFQETYWQIIFVYLNINSTKMLSLLSLLKEKTTCWNYKIREKGNKDILFLQFYYILAMFPFLKNVYLARQGWCTPLVWELERQRQAELCEHEASLV